MTGRERMEAAFSEGGTGEIPAVICYEGIFLRDHWKQIISCPWWYGHSYSLEDRITWHRDAITSIGQAWFSLPVFYTVQERQRFSIDVRPEGVYRVDAESGEEERLAEPVIGGTHRRRAIGSGTGPASREDVDRAIPPSDFDPDRFHEDGRDDLAVRMLEEFGGEFFPTRSTDSPLWRSLELWGFEEAMVKIVDEPALVEYACARFLEHCIVQVQESAALGARAVWIAECWTDLISPEVFRSLNVPFMRELVEAIRQAGMKSIYYYCGDPGDRWDAILSVGADALALEESKKGFRIDIAEVAARVDGACTLLGNLDAMDLLQNGSEEALGAEVARQIAAGRLNRSRFIMSMGSPVTPGTHLERVQRYCQMVRELGGAV